MFRVTAPPVESQLFALPPIVKVIAAGTTIDTQGPTVIPDSRTSNVGLTQPNGTSIQLMSLEIAQIILSNIGANSVNYCYGTQCDGDQNITGTIAAGASVNILTRQAISCWSKSGTTVSATIIVRYDKVPTNDNFNLTITQ
jgi:hypothetical protein